MNQSANQTIVTCQKCESEKSVNEMASCHFKGKITYECLDGKNCKSKSQIEREAKQKKDKEEIDKYRHSPKEEQLKEKY